ncbi:tRNA 2-selenouridine synthase [mine drainage metagenome]|uniref:tRNA 2-selenouridine synthase n=1 Tax=mine drainage metagenome TaxID=410659 RepID=A0A1J5NX32_9ZZZZ
MCAAPRIRIAAPLEARAAYLARAYADLTSDAAELAAVIGRLRHLYAAEVIEGWLKLAAEGEFEPLAHDLMQRHYDPRYAKQRERTAEDAGRVVETADLGPAALEGVADRIAGML